MGLLIILSRVDFPPPDSINVVIKIETGDGSLIPLGTRTFTDPWQTSDIDPNKAEKISSQGALVFR